MRRLLFILPAVVLVLLGAVFAALLWSPRDPGEIPSPFIGKPVPAFRLPALDGGGEEPPVSKSAAPGRGGGEEPPVSKSAAPGRGGGEVSEADLKGRVSVLNVFASWCLPCKIEHPILMRIAREGKARVVGLNYKDRPADAKKWLADMGNPFARVAADEKGRVAIDFGVYGVPETFIVDAGGIIRYKHVGPIHPSEYAEKIAPVIERLAREEAKP